jgi:hypothetical protein
MECNGILRTFLNQIAKIGRNQQLRIQISLIFILSLLSSEGLAFMGFWGHGPMSTDNLYMDLGYKYSKLIGQPAHLVGAEFGVRHDSGLETGVEMYSTASDVNPGGDINAEKVQLLYGGLHFSYSSWPDAFVRPKLSVGIGMGRVSFQEKRKEGQTASPGSDSNSDGGYGHMGNNMGGMISFEPGIFAEFTIDPKFKVGVGGTYRLLSGSTDAEIDGSDLSGKTLSIYVRFQ